jgi:transposase-like protein
VVYQVRPEAKRFFKRLLKSHGGEPRKIVTDKHLISAGNYRDLWISAFGEWGRVVA